MSLTLSLRGRQPKTGGCAEAPRLRQDRL